MTIEYKILAIDGLIFHLCPNCNILYLPEYENKEEAHLGSIGHEQHQSGICSDKCWHEFLGFDCFLNKDDSDPEYFEEDD